MYLWTIVLLSALAVVSSYTLRTFPLPLIFSVVAAGTAEALIRKFYLKHAFKIPFSGLITGVIIGSVTPINAPLLLILIAVAIAVLSKFFVQYRSLNVFNPASVGLVIALAIFGLGDEWWAAGNYNLYGIAITLTPILIILAYEARRLTTAASFVVVSLVSAMLLEGAGALTPIGMIMLLFGINYYFAFVMLVEPKTSPNNRYAQVGYGAAIALIYLGLALFRSPYPLLIALLVGNALYAVYRRYGKRR
jgi:Na+-transporting NADH:ubiquinone oxidoreductase subunit NqrB